MGSIKIIKSGTFGDETAIFLANEGDYESHLAAILHAVIFLTEAFVIAKSKNWKSKKGGE